MLPVKAICDRRARRYGHPVCIQYCYSDTGRTVQNTEIYIPFKYWNVKQQRIKPDLPAEYGQADKLNDEIKRQQRLMEDLIQLAVKKEINPLEFVRSTFKPDLDLSTLDTKVKEAQEAAAQEAEKARPNLDIYYQIDQYIESRRKKVCKDMPRIWRNMKEHLMAYEEWSKKKVSFDGLDFTFYEEFVDFLTYDYVQRRRKAHIVGLKVNTVGKTIKQLRTFLRNRMRKRIVPTIDMEGWTILEEEVDAVYLDWDEITLVKQVDLSRFPHLEEYRADFVLGCLTALRFSDFSRLDEHDVRGNMLYKKQEKSDHWVCVPLHPDALGILKSRFEKSTSPLTNAEFNRHIKTICKLAGITKLVKHSHKKGNKDIVEVKPKYAWITSHTCRRSFCTNEFLAGTPVELIMKISGHKSVKDFYKYIRISPEEAARRIQEIWERRGQLTTLTSITSSAPLRQ